MEKGPVHRSRRKAFQCFAAIAELHCGNGSPVDQNNGWFSVRSALATPAQGWKLHLSASLADAAKILERSLPLLLEEQVDFKFVGSAKTLARLNEGEYGLPQVGKFITVYPRTDEQAVRIATLLDNALQGLNGPAVPSDRRLRSRSPVYYRYGAFQRRFMQTTLGEIVPVLQGSDSKLVPDIRPLSYIPPNGVTDPFEALGLADPRGAPNRYVANRYLLITTIRQAGRGDIYLAVDLANPRRCVLKQFREHASLDAFGRSGIKRMKHEAEILNILSKIPQVPRLLDVVSDGDEQFLVLDDIAGISLDSHLNQLARHAKRVPPAQLLAWAKEIAEIGRQIHSCGVVYRDLKAAHVVITPKGDLKLIDFDLAHRIECGEPPFGCGTRGYMSPQQYAGEIPSFTDDIYSFGALMYGLLTATEPALAPNPADLFSRAPQLLDPTIGSSWIHGIAQCLNDDPKARFGSFRQLQYCWLETMHCENELHGKPECDLSRTWVNREEWARDSAQRVADTLCSTAANKTGEHGLAWATCYDDAAEQRYRDLAVGNAGGVIALAKLSQFGCPLHLETLESATSWLSSAPRFPGTPLAGLYVGESGVGIALLRSGQTLREEKWIQAALQTADFVARLPFASPDLYHGTAGRLRFHLELWRVTNEARQLSAAKAAGDTLIEQAEESPLGTLWPVPEDYGTLGGRAYFGYAHGAAGVGDVLLDLFAATGEEKYRMLAERTVKLLCCSAEISRRGLPFAAWPASPGEDVAPPFWCHGATGIGRFLLHGAQQHLHPRAMEMARMAANACAVKARWAAPTLCHGLAGNIDFLLEMWHVTGESCRLEQAWDLAAILRTSAVETDHGLAWASDSPRVFTPDYLVGYAGVALCLLQLSRSSDRYESLI